MGSRVYWRNYFVTIFIFRFFINPEVGLFGVTKENGLNIRVSMLVAGLWMFLAVLPVLYNVPVKIMLDLPKKTSLFESYRHLWKTVKLINKEAPQTFLFLVGFSYFP